MTPCLLALDVDGTLADSSGRIRPRTRRAVSAARERGVVVVVATGRPWMVAERTVADIGSAHYAICSNGSMSLELDAAGPRVIRNVFLPDDLVPGTVSRLRDSLPGVRFALEFELGAKSEPGWKERLPPGVPLGRYVDDILTLIPERGPVRKLVVFHDDYDDRINALRAAVAGAVDDGIQVAVAGLPFVEVGLPGINKAVALAEICDRLGLVADDVVAFGDEANDAEMREGAGWGGARGNASAAARAAADEVALSNDED
ncbi:MAG: HAD hydrolase family protein, partial [Microthrixaceae bacterium]